MTSGQFPDFGSAKPRKSFFRRLKPSFAIPFALFFALLIGLGWFQSSTETDLPKIGVLEIYGIIFDPEFVVASIEELENQGIEALVVRIDSPGGTVAASQEIYERLKAFDEEVPVYASMLNEAASGGYYVALGADRIFANQGTTTGSIGVILSGYNFAGLMEMIGIEPVTYKAGAMKDLFSPNREATAEEIEVLNGFLSDVHEQFREAVVEARPNLAEGEIARLTDGRIFSGRQAVNEGLVDEIASFDQVIERLKEEREIEEFELVYPAFEEGGWLFRLIDNVSMLSRADPRSFLTGLGKPVPMFIRP